MKRKTIISLVLAAGLLLIGAVAYGHSSDYGDQGYYGTGYGYYCGPDCRYGHVYGAGYYGNANIPASGDDAPYYGRRHARRNLRAYNDRYDCGNRWMRHGGYGWMGPGGCRWW
jgi:hypothetical protein